MHQHKAYLFKPAADKNTILEKQFFSVPNTESLCFPGVDSCIVLIFVCDSRMVGLHLSLLDSQEPAAIVGTDSAAIGGQMRQSVHAVLEIIPNFDIDNIRAYLVVGDFNNEAWPAVMSDLTADFDFNETAWLSLRGELSLHYSDKDNKIEVLEST